MFSQHRFKVFQSIIILNFCRNFSRLAKKVYFYVSKPLHIKRLAYRGCTASTSNIGNFECLNHYFFKTSAIALPISAGLTTTLTPASRNAAIFSAAVPAPPETIAPACPIRLPLGAV